MAAGLKRTIKKLLPIKLVAYIQAVRWWRAVERVHRRTGIRDFCSQVVASYGTTVQYGPFKGMKFTHEGLMTACNTSALLRAATKEKYTRGYLLCVPASMNELWISAQRKDTTRSVSHYGPGLMWMPTTQRPSRDVCAKQWQN